jgi:hypothetical protein
MRIATRPRAYGRLAATAAVAVAGAFVVPATDGARPIWLKLQTSRFGVVSQLDENQTRRWATEFDRFIDGMHQLYAVNEARLPPLTIVLFDQPRDFAPYRIKTESGQVKVQGFFGNVGGWSVIGMAQRRATAETRHIVYHEAVHWFLSANDVGRPIWFEEGLAEALSTFEVEDGKGQWGHAVLENLNYLRQYGVRSVKEFLRASRDESLRIDGYYPEAWAFVHYLIFGNNGAQRSNLQEFLNQLRQTDPDTAFDKAFGKSYNEMTYELRTYIEKGRYGIGLTNFRENDSDIVVEPASPANVEFALARLAVAGGNDDLGRKHAAAAAAMAPEAPEVYELLAVLAERAGDAAGEQSALDKAIELASTDASVYAMRASQLIEQNERPSSPIDDLLAAEVARRAADLSNRAILLQPTRSEAYETFALSLLNADSFTDQDDAAIAAGLRASPKEGLLLVAQAALERGRGDTAKAARLLRDSNTAPFELPGRYRASITALHDNWFLPWVLGQVDEQAGKGDFASAGAIIDEQLADPSVTGGTRKSLETMRADVRGFERLREAHAMQQAGRAGQARAILHAIENDPNVSAGFRRQVQRALDSLSQE